MVERDKTLICEDNGGDADDLVSQGAGEQWHWKPSPTAVAGWVLLILDGNDKMIIERCPGTLCAAKYKTALTAETLCKDCGRPFTTKCLLQVTIILMIIFVRLLGMGPFTTRFMLVVTRIILFQRRRNIKQWPNVIFRFAESRTRFCAPSVAKNSAASASSM